MTKKSFGQLAATLAGISLTSYAIAGDKNPKKPAKPKGPPTGECHGVNSCKAKGECGSPDWECAGNNACKGQGWLTKTEAQCKKLGGKFKPDPA
jgi:hypothetical protein